MPAGDSVRLTAVAVADHTRAYDEFLSLYHTAFPPIEQIPEAYFQRSIHAEGATVTAYYADDRFVGFTFTCETEPFLFLYFFAVAPELRSQGFGTEIIRDHLMTGYPGKPIILNVEAPDDAAEDNALRLKRRAFYARAGFVPLNYLFSDERVLFQILATSADIDIDAYETFLKSVYRTQDLEDTVHILPVATG